MRAAHRLRDGDWAKEIIALSTKNDPKKGVNPTTLQFAVELLAETGRMEEARALLKVRSALPVLTTTAWFALCSPTLLDPSFAHAKAFKGQGRQLFSHCCECPSCSPCSGKLKKKSLLLPLFRRLFFRSAHPLLLFILVNMDGFPFQDWTPCATIRINHVDFSKLLLCCEQHIGSDVLLELYQVGWSSGLVFTLRKFLWPALHHTPF